jgi:hypothetical protein
VKKSSSNKFLIAAAAIAGLVLFTRRKPLTPIARDGTVCRYGPAPGSRAKFPTYTGIVKGGRCVIAGGQSIPLTDPGVSVG